MWYKHYIGKEQECKGRKIGAGLKTRDNYQNWKWNERKDKSKRGIAAKWGNTT